MPSVVTLDVFSGRMNPAWVVSDEQVVELKRKARPGAGVGPLSLLGYRGLQVNPIASERGPPAPSLEGFAIGANGAVVAGQRDAEEFLLSTAASQIDDQLRAYVREAIARGPDMAAIQAAAAAA